jgi:5'-phosphate synthase pdxT subunit
MKRIGVLALQGSVIEHIKMLSQIGDVQPVEIRHRSELDDISGLILPGGESTTIGKLINEFNIADVLKEKIKNGLPVWGTCAGMILLAKEIKGENLYHLGVMDIAVRRNAYGSQLDSFSYNCVIPEITQSEIPLVFIRAPWIEEISGDTRVLLEVKGRIVVAKQRNMLVTSFHPELTDDIAFHKYFVSKMC